MAAYRGADGSVTIAGEAVAYIDSWSLAPEIGTAEITAFGNSARAYSSTLRGWSGSFTGTLDRTDTDQADLIDQFEDGTLGNIALRLQTTAAAYWGGTVRLTGMNVNSAVADKVSITFNFIGNGNLSYT
jgi:hypothetical protein